MFVTARGVRVALRQLRKAPGFTLTVVLTLALGIGATTAIFSIVEGILLRPLPFQDADRLVLLGDHLGARPALSVTAREIARYSGATEAFSSLGGFITAEYELSGGARPEEVYGARLDASVFPTLGVQPIAGRLFTAREESAHEPVAIISYAMWMNRYERDPRAIGRSLVLDRRTYTIIGVMPRSFEFPLQAGRLEQSQLWVPLSLTPDELSDQHDGFWGYHLVARLKNGVSLAQAANDADRVARQILADFPPRMSAIHIRGDVDPLREFAVSEIRPLLRTLFFAVGIVLLIACVNVSGMLLVRAIRHRREYAVRLALGARPMVIIGEAMIEGLLLSMAGALLGLAVAATAIRAALRLLPESMPRIDSISMDGAVVTFALSLALLTGAVCSLAPAFAALRTNLIESLKEGARTATGGASHAWLRSTLVISEVAIALVLLTVSGALLRSFQKMREVDPGFRADHVVVAGYQLPLMQYPASVSVDAFNRAVVEQLSNKPGIVAAGITNVLPASGFSGMGAYTIEDAPTEDWKLKFAAFALIYGDYFGAMRIPLLEGRTFAANDNAGAPPVVIVNESMAKDCWPGQSALGKRMHVGNPQRILPWATVVGVVADTKIGANDEPSDEQWYTPTEQPATLYGTETSGKLTDPAGGYITIRSTLPAEHMVATLRTSIAEIDPLLALQQVRPMTEAVVNIEAPRRFNTDLISAFAAGALLLAITGMYAVVAFSASLRTQEMAIRMAVGAQRREIARLVLLSGAKLALAGCALGVLGSLAISQVVSAFLFEVSATDPVVYGAATLVMMPMALLASAIPAMRAASTDPNKALRAI